MSKKGLSRLIVPISLVVALALGTPLLSGCLPGAPAAPPTEVQPIKIGAPLPLTGWAAADGTGYYQGLTFAVAEINAKGGLLGRPVEIVLFDTKDFAPETLKLAADQLVGVDKVDMASGGWAGWGGDVIAFGKYDPPFFMYDGATTSLETIALPDNSNVFQGSLPEVDSGRSAWNFLKALPYEYPNNKIALIGTDDAWGTGFVESLRDLALADGWEVPIYEIVPYGVMEWGPILSKVRAEEPALLHIEIVSPPDVIAFFRQFMEDPTPTLLSYGYSMAPPDFIMEMGTEADGIVGWPGGYVAFPAPTPEVAEWLDSFVYKFGNPPAGGAPWMYNSFMMWAEAVRQVGDPTDYDAIVQWLKDTPFQSMPGMRTINFDERNVVPFEEFADVWAQVQGGEFKTLYHHVYGNPYVDYEGKSYEFLIPRWIE